jgi:hypothetical protein
MAEHLGTHPTRLYLPAFNAEINGRALTAHVDTGGSFLHMGPDRARAWGIKTVKYGTGRAHFTSMRVGLSYGIAERFVLGDVVLRNVPVDVLDTLTGEGDLVIFGTNLLEQSICGAFIRCSRAAGSVPGTISTGLSIRDWSHSIRTAAAGSDRHPSPPRSAGSGSGASPAWTSGEGTSSRRYLSGWAHSSKIAR